MFQPRPAIMGFARAKLARYAARMAVFMGKFTAVKARHGHIHQFGTGFESVIVNSCVAPQQHGFCARFQVEMFQFVKRVGRTARTARRGAKQRQSLHAVTMGEGKFLRHHAAK